VNSAMGQIPCSTERISCIIINTSVGINQKEQGGPLPQGQHR